MIYPGEARRIAREIRRVNGRVLHIYFGHIAVHLLPILRNPPVPVIVSFHGADAMVDLDQPAYRRATLEMLGLARLVLVRSQSLADRIIEVGCPPEKIRIHRTGIPLERFAFTPRPFPADGAWRFFQACRLIPKKGLHTTLRAFARFSERYPRDIPGVATLPELVDALGLPASALLIEHNGLALLRDEWPERPLADGDRIEFLRITAGG